MIRGNQKLGHALTILVRQDVEENIMHADVSAWGAPSECHRDVSRGEDFRRRQAERHAAAVSGIRRSLLVREARRRLGSEKQLRRALDRCFDRLNTKLNPFIDC